MSRLKLVTFIGPSGSGKTTLANSTGLPILLSLTTRPPRDGEIDGTDYHFVTRKYFLTRQINDFLLENIQYAGNNYGIDKEDLEQLLRSDILHQRVVTIEGYEALKSVMPVDSLLSFFVYAPLAEVRTRLMERNSGSGTTEMIERMKTYDSDLQSRELCDHVILNKRGQLARNIQIVNFIISLYKDA